MQLPSGMTPAHLRNACEQAIARGQTILVQPGDILALLVMLDLRERLDPDVRRCAQSTLSIAEHRADAYPNDQTMKELIAAAQRVLKHEPKPDLSGVAS